MTIQLLAHCHTMTLTVQVTWCVVSAIVGSTLLLMASITSWCEHGSLMTSAVTEWQLGALQRLSSEMSNMTKYIIHAKQD